MKTTQTALNIGETYEVLCGMKNKNYGALTLLRINPISGFYLFIKDIKEDVELHNTSIEGVVQADLIDSQKRYEGQLEQVFVTHMSSRRSKDQIELRDFRKELKDKKEAYQKSREGLEAKTGETQ
jgi:predicted RNA-binding protein